MKRTMFTFLSLLLISGPSPVAAKILIPMDLTQTDHLKAYGVAYAALQKGVNVEWLLNYRGGSFLMNEDPGLMKLARLRGVVFEDVEGAQVAGIHKEIEENNMEVVLLEKAPLLAVYVPATRDPWDDAVRLALDYAEIPYATVWDEQVLAGALGQYDWLHLHHEDFTGQYGKFYASFKETEWYREEVRLNEKTAQKLKFAKVSQMKAAVARRIREYVEDGGFLFAMCSAPTTLDIALAAQGVDVVPKEFDGDAVEPDCQKKLDFRRTLAFQDFQVETNPLIYEHSNIDTTPESTLRGPDTYFTLFDFSAKYDPVPAMLTQDHVALVNEFMGQETGFHRDKIKSSVTVLGLVDKTDEVKYLHGTLGRGTFTFLGGHDPEDFQHLVGDPPTKLALHRNSPGYRLILNNVLFPGAKKKDLKT